jgi:ribonuclease BN (tRNA processing enzyme)
MKIEILGCSGSVSRGFNTTSILVQGKILIDAGSVMTALEPEDAVRIKAVLLTHPHIDHIKELPFLVDALYANRSRGIRIMGSPKTITAIKAHIFNGLIWPDIAQLNAEEDFVTLETLPEGELEIEGLRVRAFPEEHTGGAYGYVVSDNGAHALFSGDTGYHQGLFDIVGGLGAALKACFIEASYPNRMERLARITRHLTPGLVARGLEGLVSGTTRVILYHIKPAYLEEVVSELPEGFEYIKGGEVIHL